MDKCFCGIPATQGVVTKDGANKGRIFFRCSKWPHNQCAYFKWGPTVVSVESTHPATHSSEWGHRTPAPTPTRPVTVDMEAFSDAAALTLRMKVIEEQVKVMETHLCYLMARDEVIKKAFQ